MPIVERHSGVPRLIQIVVDIPKDAAKVFLAEGHAVDAHALAYLDQVRRPVSGSNGDKVTRRGELVVTVPRPGGAAGCSKGISKPRNEGEWFTASECRVLERRGTLFQIQCE